VKIVRTFVSANMLYRLTEAVRVENIPVFEVCEKEERQFVV